MEEYWREGGMLREGAKEMPTSNAIAENKCWVLSQVKSAIWFMVKTLSQSKRMLVWYSITPNNVIKAESCLKLLPGITDSQMALPL